MSADLSETLLRRLCSGDASAAEQVFLAYQPYLRMMVRRLLSPGLRAKFDSADVIQSVWVNLLRGIREGRWHFADATHLRAFLVKATRNRFLNRARRHRVPLQRQERLEIADLRGSAHPQQSQASDFVRAKELWARLLALCPPAHRELLKLKGQGYALAEIAARTGLHPSSVRRILYDLARRFAFELRRQTPPDFS